MPEVQRINITLPKNLVNKSKVLIDEGIYSNFSELVREGIKDEIELNKNQIQKTKLIRAWFEEEKGKGLDTSNLSKEEILKRLRKTREELWEEKYKHIYG
ncbi:hypothetical protein HYT57_03245 [Candidatus Woesearchaeota archaeon]|nr:hypothetical protein [Candidatus Woesearchaeota archaeon]